MSDPAMMQLRSVWDAAPRRDSPRRRKEPTALVVHHTAGTRPRDFTEAKTVVKAVQEFHQDTRGWTDIAYNFLVTPTGVLLEGRGSDFQNGANTPRNHNTLSICLLGTMGRDAMTDAEKLTLRRIRQHYGLPVLPHSAVSSTECPGAPVHDWIEAGMPAEPATDRLRLAVVDLGEAYERVRAIVEDE